MSISGRFRRSKGAGKELGWLTKMRLEDSEKRVFGRTRGGGSGAGIGFEWGRRQAVKRVCLCDLLCLDFPHSYPQYHISKKAKRGHFPSYTHLLAYKNCIREINDQTNDETRNRTYT